MGWNWLVIMFVLTFKSLITESILIRYELLSAVNTCPRCFSILTFLIIFPHSVMLQLFDSTLLLENINRVHLSGLNFNLYSFAYFSQILIKYLNAVHVGVRSTISSAYANAFAQILPI